MKLKLTGTEMELEDLKMKVREYLKQTSGDVPLLIQKIRNELTTMSQEN